MKQLLTTILCFFFLQLSAQTSDEKAILNLLQSQAEEWNKGSIDEFMKGYWNNDSLMFVGNNGVTYGYTNTLNNYKKNYNNADQMGKLSFEFLKVKKISSEYYWVLGKFFLKRTVGDASGYYTLLFRKINGKWLIVADHSS